MEEGQKVAREIVGLTEGARRATGVWPTAGSGVGPLSAKQRWSVPRKREVALRLLRGESVAVMSRELGVEIYCLEKWRDKALAGIEAALREREGDPIKGEGKSGLLL